MSEKIPEFPLQFPAPAPVVPRRRGRPPEERDPATGTNWLQVRRWARLGADRDTILTALGLDFGRLQDVTFAGRLAREMARGAAMLQIDLLAERDRLGKRGKVSAVLAGLRNKSGWDRPDSAARASARPDGEAAVAELEKILSRVRER